MSERKSEAREAASIGTRIWRAAVGLAAPAGLAVALVLLVPPSLYLWLKALHIVSVTTWIAGMVALPPVFALHARLGAGSATGALKTIEHALMRRVVNPGMVATWGLGLWLAWTADWWRSGWLSAKLALVIALSAVHGYVSAETRRLATDRFPQLTGIYIIVNAVSAAVAVAIVLLAVVKPF